MKSKKKQNKAKQINKKKLTKKQLITIISILAVICVITAAIITTLAIRKKINDKAVRIGFYGLSEEMCTLIKEKIPVEEEVILDVQVIPEEAFEPSVIKSKYDMLFTWRGEVTDYLADSSEDIPNRIFETMPNSLRDKKKKCIPILLDNCEFTFRTEIVNKLGGTVPVSFKDFEEYLEASKKYVFSPFFCNGAEDRILIDFIGAMVEAKTGLSGYNKFIEELRKAESLEDVLDIKIEDSSLHEILDMLKSWPKEGYAHPAWFNGRGNDLLYFAEENQVSVFFTTLSAHRKIPYNVIKNYESSLVPTNQSAGNYGLIAPAVSAMLISDNSNCKRYLAGFFTEEVQEELSNKTMLAPVHYRAQAYDRQADDVRFWSASCAGGAIPDLYLAVYQRDKEKLKKMCDEIRGYIR